MSTHKKPEKDDPPPSKANLERHVYEAMRSLGWIIPTTEEDVARAESMLSREAVELPEELKNPYHILESMDTDCPASDPEPVPVDAEVEENLARAAREGGVIRPEIEQRMRRDRQAAEQKIT
jgi:hypothetical protein